MPIKDQLRNYDYKIYDNAEIYKFYFETNNGQYAFLPTSHIKDQIADLLDII